MSLLAVVAVLAKSLCESASERRLEGRTEMVLCKALISQPH